MSKKHFLFVMWEGGGTVPPELGVARKLVRRGHRVTVLGDDSIGPEVSAAGAGFVGYVDAPNRRTKGIDEDPLRDWEARDGAEIFSRVINGIMCGPALGVARDVLAVHQNDPIDCVAACAFRLGATMAAERAGLPSVVLFPNVDFRPAPGRPGLGPGLHPLAGPEGEARDAEVWSACRDLFGQGQPALDSARRALGLDTTNHPWEEYDRADRVLLLTSRHFEYPYELPPGTLVAGPVLDEPSWATPRDIRPGDLSGPLVLVSLGSSFQNQLGLYQRILDAVGDMPLTAVVTLGGVFDPEELNAKNAHVFRSAPHGPILEHAAAFVTHGGHGSVMKGLAAGVPMLCIPMGREQPENAARVEWHGAGLRLDPPATIDEIRGGLQRLLSDDRFHDNAGEISRKMRSEVAEDIAVRELERVADRPTASGVTSQAAGQVTDPFPTGMPSPTG